MCFLLAFALFVFKDNLIIRIILHAIFVETIHNLLISSTLYDVFLKLKQEASMDCFCRLVGWSVGWFVETSVDNSLPELIVPLRLFISTSCVLRMQTFIYSNY